MLIERLSIATPAYKEEAGISDLIKNWMAFLKSRSELKEFEIVVCNDGSPDQTGIILNDLSQEFSQVKVIHHTKNQGAAAALITAIRNTKLDWVFLLDSDGQFPVNNYQLFANSLEQNNDLALIGVRPQKKNAILSKAGSFLSGWLCNLLHGTNYRDFNSALKLVRGDLLRSLTLEARGLNYSTEITSRLIENGIQMKEVPAVHISRLTGKSSLKLRDGFFRILFVFYLGYRLLLIKLGVLQTKNYEI